MCMLAHLQVLSMVNYEMNNSLPELFRPYHSFIEIPVTSSLIRNKLVLRLILVYFLQVFFSHHNNINGRW